ncbi:hypothetical protein M9Y10_029331 [Tritrichomonas musculus]|uniref:Myb-like DNA-binding domain containing protein n=1 Tax=Tritrichomonas musculus TaxID=1915356 RepID=A0ABR2KLU4_9EUKA
MHQTMERFHHKQKFTKKEDAQLIRLVKKYGIQSWEEIANHMQRRTGRQCRDRYNNYLSDNFKKGSWTEYEDKLIISLYQKMGPHWLNMSKSLPGRSGNDIKNRWHKTLVKKYNDKIADLKNCDIKQIDSINKNTTESKTCHENEKTVISVNKSEIENQSYQKSSQIKNGNVIRIFEFYETTGKQWDMFPREEEKKYRF